MAFSQEKSCATAFSWWARQSAGALPNMWTVALGPMAGDDDSHSIDAEQELLYVPSQAGNGEKIQEHTQLHEGEPAESC